MSSSEQQSLLKKAFTRQSQITKQQISNILYIFKQIIGIIIGVSMAFSQMTGIYAILIYVAVSFLIAYFYVFRFLQVEDDQIEAMEVFKQSWGLGFFNFMFTWIITYNMLNFYKF